MSPKFSNVFKSKESAGLLQVLRYFMHCIKENNILMGLQKFFF